MTDKLREAAQAALEALINGKNVRAGEGGTKRQSTLEDAAIEQLRAALAEQPPEPEMRRCQRCWEPMLMPCQHKIMLQEWLDKTEWVQKTAAPGELGLHRADVLKRRIDTLRAALAEQDAKPVAWGWFKDGEVYDSISPELHADYEGRYTVPLYVHPPRREWQGLTDEELLDAYWTAPPSWDRHTVGLRAVEAALKEKNGEPRGTSSLTEAI